MFLGNEYFQLNGRTNLSGVVMFLEASLDEDCLFKGNAVRLGVGVTCFDKSHSICNHE